MSDAGKFLGLPKTAGYRPTVFGGYMMQSLFTGQWPMFLLGEVEAMRYDPKIQLATAILRAPLHQCKWNVSAARADVARFVDAQLRKIWQSSLRKLMNYIDYGHVGGEVTYKPEQGHIVFDQLRDVYPRDVLPLCDHRLGGLVGVQVKNYLGGGVNPAGNMQEPSLVNLFSPRAFWVAHRARYAGYYGYSRFNGAWWPWLEKRGRHGATDVRRTWYIKNAYRGMRIRHPPGYIERPDGSLQANQDYARELAEKAETGGVMAMPNAKNPNDSDYQWQVEDPAVNGDLAGVREYARDLDREILEGFEIPPEVAEAAEVGAGWSGRSVPFMVFLSGEDEIAAELLESIDRWILRPLVEVNFGPQQSYVIEPVSLIELLGQAKEDAGQAPQPNSQPPTLGGERPATAQRVQMSLDGTTDTDRANKESASRLLDDIIDQGSQAGVIAGNEIRRKIRALVKKKSRKPN